jgi:hypothetical protein
MQGDQPRHVKDGIILGRKRRKKERVAGKLAENSPSFFEAA